MQEMEDMWVQSLGTEDPWEENGNPLQYSCLENFTDRGAWWPTVHGITELDTTEWLSMLSISKVAIVLSSSMGLLLVLHFFEIYVFTF